MSKCGVVFSCVCYACKAKVEEAKKNLAKDRLASAIKEQLLVVFAEAPFRMSQELNKCYVAALLHWTPHCIDIC